MESGVGIIASSRGIITISFLGPSGLVVDSIVISTFFLSPKTTKTLLLYCPSTRRLDSEIVRLYLYSLEAFSYFKSQVFCLFLLFSLIFFIFLILIYLRPLVSNLSFNTIYLRISLLRRRIESIRLLFFLKRVEIL